MVEWVVFREVVPDSRKGRLADQVYALEQVGSVRASDRHAAIGAARGRYGHRVDVMSTLSWGCWQSEQKSLDASIRTPVLEPGKRRRRVS